MQRNKSVRNGTAVHEFSCHLLSPYLICKATLQLTKNTWTNKIVTAEPPLSSMEGLTGTKYQLQLLLAPSLKNDSSIYSHTTSVYEQSTKKTNHSPPILLSPANRNSRTQLIKLSWHILRVYANSTRFHVSVSWLYVQSSSVKIISLHTNNIPLTKRQSTNTAQTDATVTAEPSSYNKEGIMRKAYQSQLLHYLPIHSHQRYNHKLVFQQFAKRRNRYRWPSALCHGGTHGRSL